MKASKKSSMRLTVAIDLMFFGKESVPLFFPKNQSMYVTNSLRDSTKRSSLRSSSPLEPIRIDEYYIRLSYTTLPIIAETPLCADTTVYLRTAKRTKVVPSRFCSLGRCFVICSNKTNWHEH